MLTKEQVKTALVKIGAIGRVKYMPDEKGFQREDLGIIDFGINSGKLWSSISKDYLEYIASDKCYTSPERKNKARKELENRRLCEGQLDLL